MWHSALQITFTRTSPAFGGSTMIVSARRSSTPNATIALHVIGCAPSVGATVHSTSEALRFDIDLRAVLPGRAAAERDLLLGVTASLRDQDVPIMILQYLEYRYTSSSIVMTHAISLVSPVCTLFAS